jgi:hypothetical protein
MASHPRNLAAAAAVEVHADSSEVQMPSLQWSHSNAGSVLQLREEWTDAR